MCLTLSDNIWCDNLENKFLFYKAGKQYHLAAFRFVGHCEEKYNQSMVVYKESILYLKDFTLSLFCFFSFLNSAIFFLDNWFSTPSCETLHFLFYFFFSDHLCRVHQNLFVMEDRHLAVVKNLSYRHDHLPGKKIKEKLVKITPLCCSSF